MKLKGVFAINKFKTSVLAIKPFRYFFGAQLAAQFGDSFSYIGLPILIYSLTGSTFALAGSFIFLLLPNILLGPILGGIVDRYNRKRMMIFSDIMRAFLVATMPFLDNITLIFIIIISLSILDILFDAAKGAIIPNIVPNEKIIDANVISQTWGQTISLIAPSVAGLIIFLFGVQYAFIINSMTFVISAILLLRVTLDNKSQKNESSREKNQIVNNFKVSLKTVRSNHILFWAVGLMTVLGLTAVPSTILRVPFIEDNLSGTSAHIGYASTCWSLGAMFAGLVTAKISKKIGKINTIIIGMIIASFASLSNSISTSIPVFLIGSIFVGIGNGISQPMVYTLYQELIPNELYGRVLGVILSITSFVSLFGILLTGPLSQIIGVREIYISAAVLAVVISLSAKFLIKNNPEKTKDIPSFDKASL
ncbi:MFS transporter [Bacillus sp. JJ1562]|uniref:MFS transporter n=1 Tax=Bacillus sp. JJ1562 TaxID=3122960 RepID=UPI003002BC70